MERYEIPCPSNNEGCPNYPDCHLSKHHIYKRELGATALAKAFIADPRNQVKVCRNIHDILDRLPPHTLPSDEYMENFLGTAT